MRVLLDVDKMWMRKQHPKAVPNAAIAEIFADEQMGNAAPAKKNVGPLHELESLNVPHDRAN